MPHTHKVLTTFMHVTDRAAAVWGPAAHTDPTLPVVHKHDDFEQASDDELQTFSVETDTEGHHYAIRRDDKPPMTHH